MNAEIVSTGSTGNFVVINDIIALDMGVPWKKVAPYSRKLQLVFISHQHIDHINKTSINLLSIERPLVRFCGGEWMVDKFISAGVSKRNIDILEPYKRYDYGVFQIEAFPLHHDVPNMGLKIFMGGEKAIYIVDTGYVDDIEAKDFDLYLLENNHIQSEIEQRIAEKQSAGEFPYEYRAADNHLSQEQAFDWLANNAGPKSRYVFLHQHK